MTNSKHTPVEAKLATKSFASLDKEINKILAQNKKDAPLESLFGTNAEVAWGSGGPPHIVKGQIINENPR